MYTAQIDCLNGKSIIIQQMTLISENDQLKFLWKVSSENKSCDVTFYNVSGIKIDDLSAPLQIAGFEIIDNSAKGWEGHSRYQVHDYEGGKIEFYCEDYYIYEV